MILHPIIDLLKRIVVALPDYGGGVQAPDLLEYEEYTIATDMLTIDTNGNTQYFADNYIPSEPGGDIGYPTILCFVDNTFIGNHSATTAARLSNFNDGNSSFSAHALTTRQFVRFGAQPLVSTVSSTSDFFIGAGSTIHRYVFVRAET